MKKSDSKQNGNGRIVPVLVIFLFSLFLVLPLIAGFIPRENGLSSLEEKRALEDFPSLTEGDAYFGRLGAWFDDHIPFRLRLIAAKKKIVQKLEQPYRTKIHPFLSRLSAPDWYDSAEYADRKTWDAPYLAPLEDSYAIYGRNDWLFFTGDESLAYFTGTNVLDEATETSWKNSLLSLKAYCDRKGILLYVSVAPNKEQVYPELMPNYYVERTDKRALRFERFLDGSGLSYDYLLDELQEAKAVRDCYMRQDTHWNQIGAYAAYRRMMERIGSPVPALSELPIGESVITGGDLSNFCGYATAYPTYYLNYKPETVLLSDVSETFHGNGKIRTMTSSAPGGRTIVLVGDSFREAEENFLYKDFSRAVSIHRDAIREPAALQAVDSLGEGDVLWLLAVERYDAGNAYAADCILKGTGASD